MGLLAALSLFPVFSFADEAASEPIAPVALATEAAPAAETTVATEAAPEIETAAEVKTEPVPAPSLPPLRAVFDPDFAPFCTTNETGNPDGFSIDLLQKAAVYMDRSVVFRPEPLRDTLSSPPAPSTDVLPAIGWMDNRQPSGWEHSIPYANSIGALIIRRTSHDILSISDLRGRVVAVPEFSAAEDFLTANPTLGITPLPLPSITDTLLALAQNRCDAALLPQIFARHHLAQGKHPHLKIADSPVPEFHIDFRFGVPADRPELLAALNDAISQAMKDGAIHTLHSRWLTPVQMAPGHTIIVGGDYSFPPWEFLDRQGQPTGYNVALTRAIAAAMGLNIEFKFMRWEKALEALANGEIDILQGLAFTSERAERFSFSSPHKITRYTAVTRVADDWHPAAFSDFSGRTVSIQRDDAIREIFRERCPDATILETSAFSESIALLVAGRCDAVVCPPQTAQSIIDSAHWKGLLIEPRTLYSSEYAYASIPGNETLLAEFSAGIRLLKNNGEYQRIHDLWFDPVAPATFPRQRLTLLLVSILLPLGIVLILLVLWVLSLRRKVTARTNELLDTESRLNQAHKMESIGQLAGGIAHDFNNMLQAILGYAEMALDQAPASGPLHEDILSIQQTAQHSAALTRQLLVFSRKRARTPKIIGLHTILHAVVEMLRRSLGSGIAIDWVPEGPEQSILADPVLFEHLLTNLCLNSRDAGATRIVIRAPKRLLTDPLATLTGEIPPGEYAELSVTDNGHGIPPDSLPHIFEPFYTTKKAGQATGLGLSTAYGIARQCHAGILVSSQPTKTTFTFHFPLRNAAPDNAFTDFGHCDIGDAPLPGGNETLLLVDDEPAILQATSRILTSLGYTILSTESPLTAINILRKNKDKIRLLLSDVIMPGMNGPEMLVRMKEIRPDLPFLFMSGYTANLLSEQQGQNVVTDFIPKPFSRTILATKVREALDSAPLPPISSPSILT